MCLISKNKDEDGDGKNGSYWDGNNDCTVIEP